MRHARKLLWAWGVGLVSTVLGYAAPGSPPADPALRSAVALAGKVGRFKVIPFRPVAGEVTLPQGQSLSADDLAGVQLQEPPLEAVAASGPSAADRAPGAAAYEMKGLLPFQLNELYAVADYGGTGNVFVYDYLAGHGVNTFFPSGYTPADRSHYPAATRWVKRVSLNWHWWFSNKKIPDGRWDALAEIDPTPEIAGWKVCDPDPAYQVLLLSMNRAPLLDRKALREQEWYPKQAPEGEQAEFEQRYYVGFARIYAAAALLAHQQGWQTVGIWSEPGMLDTWAPSGNLWARMTEPIADPETSWAWNAYGKLIAANVDLIVQATNFPYWNEAGNVLWLLRNSDNMAALNASLPEEERPGLVQIATPTSSGGGGGWRWWAGQPLTEETITALTVMPLLAGARGCGVTLGLDPKVSSSVLPPLREGLDAMLKDTFTLRPTGPVPDLPEVTFKPNDVVHVTMLGADGSVTFQRVQPGMPNNGVGDWAPTFTLPQAELDRHRMTLDANLRGMVRGLALVKPFEALIRQGEAKREVRPQVQNYDTLPIVRRVKYGRHHLLAAWDPWGYKRPREAVLRDFDGHAGLTLRVPADAQVRLYLLEEANQ